MCFYLKFHRPRTTGSVLFRLLKCLTVSYFLTCALHSAAYAETQRPVRFGLWVEAEGTNRPFRSAAEFERYRSFISHPSFTDLYCQVYRHGRSWYPSMLADDTPYREALAQGIDPLRETIRQAHRQGKRVHAWVNVLRIGLEPTPLVSVIGKDAALVDTAGNSLLDYDADGNPPGALNGRFMLETPGVWLDPSSAHLRHYLVETVRDLLVAYPELDGIHLDMVRMPFSLRKTKSARSALRPEFGFGKESLRRFFRFSGHSRVYDSPSQVALLRGSESWLAWQRAQVTLLVFEIRELLNRLAPEMELSAAVIASPERSYMEAKQDWAEWLRGGLVQSVLPMAYTKDLAAFRRQTDHAVKIAGGDKVVMGLGAWLMSKEPKQLIRQGNIAMERGASGVTLFSYSNLVSSGDLPLVERFSSSVFSAAE